MRGRLIVLEGIDKAGKETQGKMLLDFFAVEGIKAVYFEQPSSNNIIGRTIKKFLNMELEIESGEAVALLYTADRHEQLKKEIIPALKKGKFVILDRYYYSTIAYQNVLYKVNESWIRALNALVPTPDVVILLDIDPETSVERTAKMGESDRHERLLLQRKVYRAYRRMIKKENFYVVDGNQSQDIVHENVKEIVKKVLGI